MLVIDLRLGEIARRVLHELGHGLLAAEAIGLLPWSRALICEEPNCSSGSLVSRRAGEPSLSLGRNCLHLARSKAKLLG
jgi:hypothetical protein